MISSNITLKTRDFNNLQLESAALAQKALSWDKINSTEQIEIKRIIDLFKEFSSRYGRSSQLFDKAQQDLYVAHVGAECITRHFLVRGQYCLIDREEDVVNGTKLSELINQVKCHISESNKVFKDLIC